ncbi:hypothetical protein LXM25_16025 [Dyadobacter sp. LJ53]|uniref:hypothetical protein n=1 Tax=Dyadobacter chenwenxiniae TaxID=2906456 RepID=UPI001F329A5F|nr:hypothetical protein [Dyadobacter chenwenxiniae]MCF0051576.1 hypothetical protein [Dyadobacter chenwenxiniae]
MEKNYEIQDEFYDKLVTSKLDEKFHYGCRLGKSIHMDEKGKCGTDLPCPVSIQAHPELPGESFVEQALNKQTK